VEDINLFCQIDRSIGRVRDGSSEQFLSHRFTPCVREGLADLCDLHGQIDGYLFRREDARFSVFNVGLLRGDCMFDGIVRRERHDRNITPQELFSGDEDLARFKGRSGRYHRSMDGNRLYMK